MRQNELGKTGLNLSRIGLGTVQFGLDYGFTKKKTQQEVNEILCFAYRQGVNLLDTARAYGDSEEMIGNYLSQSKDRFIVATKLDKINREEALEAAVLERKVCRSVETSLKMLGVPCLDILQLHQTEDYLIRNEQFWKILSGLKSQKMLKHIGVSVYEPVEAEMLLDRYADEVSMLQIPYNIFDRRFESLEKRYAEARMGIVSRSVFLKGLVPCPVESLPDEVKGLAEVKERLEGYAKEQLSTPSDLALRFVHGKAFIHSMILGIGSLNELKANLQAVERKLPLNNWSQFDDLIINDPQLIDPRKWKSM